MIKPEALEALKNYQQADEDGVMVLVSRQALHEAIAELIPAVAAAPPSDRTEIAWLLLSRWENIARNGGEKWLANHPLVQETTDLLNNEAVASRSFDNTVVAWRWRHVNAIDQSWNYENLPIKHHDEYLEVEPLAVSRPHQLGGS